MIRECQRLVLGSVKERQRVTKRTSEVSERKGLGSVRVSDRE